MNAPFRPSPRLEFSPADLSTSTASLAVFTDADRSIAQRRRRTTKDLSLPGNRLRMTDRRTADPKEKSRDGGVDITRVQSDVLRIKNVRELARLAGSCGAAGPGQATKARTVGQSLCDHSLSLCVAWSWQMPKNRNGQGRASSVRSGLKGKKTSSPPSFIAVCTFVSVRLVSVDVVRPFSRGFLEGCGRRGGRDGGRPDERRGRDLYRSNRSPREKTAVLNDYVALIMGVNCEPST